MTNNEKEMLKLFNVEELEKRYEMRRLWKNDEREQRRCWHGNKSIPK